MKFGISAFGWTATIRESHSALFEFVRETGFEAFEIPMFDPRDLPVRELVRAYRANQPECTICCILPTQINPRIGVTLDTFHANIEEKNTPAGIDALGPRLKHIHLSENDRGLLGTGQVDFPAISVALRRNQHHGYLVVEGFGYCAGEISAPGYLWANPAVTHGD